MLIACQAKKSNAHKIPAVIHVDNSCRVQSVSKKINYKFWKLIQEFDKITKIPVILNTSFNIKGEPIVNTSEDAIRCFRKYNIDYLVLGSKPCEKKIIMHLFVVDLSVSLDMLSPIIYLINKKKQKFFLSTLIRYKIIIKKIIN